VEMKWKNMLARTEYSTVREYLRKLYI